MLAADVAGCSRLMGADEVGTARALREHRAVTDALVSKHGGRIVKTTCDGVLLEFPSLVGGVECAVRGLSSNEPHTILCSEAGARAVAREIGRFVA
jgi:class 3 adenylate cyclase